MKHLGSPVISGIILLMLLTAPVMATTETPVSDVVGGNNAEATATTAPTTAANPETPLSLDIPSQTDNPSTIITFTNPSKDNVAVQLEIDSKEFIDITSPYTFPALSIGKHTLEFKYQDENGSTQIYDTSIIIIPRAPILNTPVITNDLVSISGTGLANSEIIAILSSGTTVITKTATIDTNGKWTIDIPKTELSTEVYSLNAYTRRYGYASNLSETTKFTLEKGSNVINANTSNKFDINSITWESVKAWGIDNQNYIITAICSLFLGIIIGISSVSQKKQRNEKKIEKKVKEKFVKANPQKKEVTLREKLMGTSNDSSTTTVSQPKEESKEEVSIKNNKDEKKENSTVVNKMDFLKDYKNFDPDNAQGKEEEVKTNVKVSLTSKK